MGDVVAAHPYASVNRPEGVLWIGTAAGCRFWWLATKARVRPVAVPQPTARRRGKPRERLGTGALPGRDPAESRVSNCSRSSRSGPP